MWSAQEQMLWLLRVSWMVDPALGRGRRLLSSLNLLAAMLRCVAQRPMMMLLTLVVWWLMLT